ncbi:MAG: hypothetical protein R3E12_13405 [Candidatus Eisenbacteria bacterium]|uniref:Uncharacterized protein n=1 Tax=Eiseniibacteriota bacterium TaxID=2212470 RepID=A0A956LVU5_UNCEI|nr:hypothetical protein [Candidatus Eisenbacteria bacterium]
MKLSMPYARLRGITRRTTLALAAVLLAAVSLAGNVHAETPHLMNYQGFLRNDDGTPVNGTVDFMEFKIYDAATGGNELWAEAYLNIPCNDGVFQITLGQATWLTESVFDGPDRWIETSIDGVPLLPRRPFTSTPYAHHAAVADIALNAGTDDDDWIIDGTNIYRTTGSVGINTTGPLTQPLQVAGDVFIGGGADGATDGASESLIIKAQSEDWVIGVQNESTAGASDFFIGLDSTEDGMFHIQDNGDVGIGTTSPSADLDVVGDVEASFYRANSNITHGGLPAPGTIYRDNVVVAWGQVFANGTLAGSFGVESAQRNGLGVYLITLPNPIPNDEISVTVMPQGYGPWFASAYTSERVGGTDIYVSIWAPQEISMPVARDQAFYFQVMGRPN